MEPEVNSNDKVIFNEDLLKELIAFREKVDVAMKAAVDEGRIIETDDGVLLKGETHSIFLPKH